MSTIDLDIQINKDPFKRVCVRVSGSNSYEELYYPYDLEDEIIESMIKRRYSEFFYNASKQILEELKQTMRNLDFKEK